MGKESTRNTFSGMKTSFNNVYMTMDQMIKSKGMEIKDSSSKEGKKVKSVADDTLDVNTLKETVKIENPNPTTTPVASPENGTASAPVELTPEEIAEQEKASLDLVADEEVTEDVTDNKEVEEETKVKEEVEEEKEVTEDVTDVAEKISDSVPNTDKEEVDGVDLEDKEAMRAYLDEKGVKYHPQLGVPKLAVLVQENS